MVRHARSLEGTQNAIRFRRPRLLESSWPTVGGRRSRARSACDGSRS